MKKSKRRIRQHLGMMIIDTSMGIVWLISLQYTFAGFGDIRIRIGLNILMAITFLITGIVRYCTLMNRYGIDDVTGGKNKAEFEMIVKGLLENEKNYVMVYANIEQFKLINDLYGSDTGDRILKQIQQIMDEELLKDEVSGRIMADNFGLFMRYHSIQKLDERLYRICRKIKSLKDDEGTSFGIRMVFGVCTAEDAEYSFEVMIEQANLACSNVDKSTHLVHMGIYDESMKKKLNREHELEMKMQKALDNREFVPYLQGKYELKNETVAGAEALVRWLDPEEGIIYPNEFIPLFEKNGFIVQLDLYMFEEVCKLIDRWESAGCQIIPISVNLSRANFAIPNFFKAYKDIMKKYTIPKKAIEFELTESLLYNNFEQVNHLVDEIHELGMTCSIDDFGSGYSSLNMLKDVRVDCLKIDRVFFSEGDGSRRGQDIIRSILGLAQALQMKTVSEGIELPEQVDFLKAMNCNYVQGYIFAKPITVEAFEHHVYLEDNT